MKYKKAKLGTLVKQVSDKNKDNALENVLGISIDKEFMPSVANIIGTDLRKYNVVKKGRFAFNPMHVGRDEKLPIALYKKDLPSLVSPAYFMCEVNSTEIIPEYLMLVFKSKEFDHLCWFHSDASVRGGLTWEDFSNIEIEYPPLQEQRKIVSSYYKLLQRIEFLDNAVSNLYSFCTLQFNELVKNKICNAKISDLIVENVKSKIPVGKAVNDGKYLFFTSGDKILRSSTFLVDGFNLFLNTGGRFDVKFFIGKASFSTDTYCIKGIKNFDFYLYFQLLNHYERISSDECFRGSALKHLKKDDMKNIDIYMPNKSEITFFNKSVSKAVYLISSYQSEKASLLKLLDVSQVYI